MCLKNMIRPHSILAHLGVFWSLLWRATVLGPVCVLAAMGAIVTLMGLVFFPFIIAVSVYAKDWLGAAAYLAAWIFSVWLWRSKWFRESVG